MSRPKKYGSYTMKDVIKHRKYIKNNPGCEVWGTAQGLKIPFHMLALDHLIAIVKWIHEHPESYPEATRRKMENLLASRQKDTIAGIIYDHT